MALHNGVAAGMAAAATLRALGGCSVTVSGAMAGADATGAGLGIGPAMQQQWELEPVLVRWETANDEKHRELAVSAETLERVFKIRDTEVLRALLLRSQMKLGNETLRATEVSTEIFEGSVYLYRLRLER